MAKTTPYSDKDFNDMLPAETKEKYLIKGTSKSWSSVFYEQKYGRVDIANLSVARAAQLVKMGAPFIQERTSKSSGKTADAESK